MTPLQRIYMVCVYAVDTGEMGHSDPFEQGECNGKDGVYPSPFLQKANHLICPC